MHKNSLVGAVLAVLATVEALPQTAKREELGANLPESAHEIEKKFQPYVDYDGDGCYNTAAIDPDGNVNHGHDATGTPEGHCHNPPLLEKSNTYSRRRCNNGYCAVMYVFLAVPIACPRNHDY